MSDHTHFVSLSICLSVNLAFSHRIFHPSRRHSFDLMVGHAHSISLSLSPYVSIDLALSRTKMIYHHV